MESVVGWLTWFAGKTGGHGTNQGHGGATVTQQPFRIPFTFPMLSGSGGSQQEAKGVRTFYIRKWGLIYGGGLPFSWSSSCSPNPPPFCVCSRNVISLHTLRRLIWFLFCLWKSGRNSNRPGERREEGKDDINQSDWEWREASTDEWLPSEKRCKVYKPDLHRALCGKPDKDWLVSGFR